MDADFWINRWQKGDIGFHRDIIHDCLKRHWPKLELKKNGAVFVPLCGKSLDMTWLAQQGHKVIGIELSELAIKTFFEYINVKPTTRSGPSFTIWSAGPYELWCGDIFNLPSDALNDAVAIYDRASLVAFPPADQQRYAEFLATNAPANAKLLLVSLHYDQSEMTGPPFSISRRRVQELFADTFKIKELERESVLEKNENLKKRGLTWVEETSYLITRS